MSRAVEKYYTVTQTACMVELHEKTVVLFIKGGKFGDGVIDLGENKPNYRIPASGINAFLASHRLFPDEPIAARSEGELRRKAA